MRKRSASTSDLVAQVIKKESLRNESIEGVELSSTTSTSTPMTQTIKKKSLSNESIERTGQSSTTSTSTPVAQAIKKKSFSGKYTSVRTCEIHVIHVKK